MALVIYQSVSCSEDGNAKTYNRIFDDMKDELNIKSGPIGYFFW